VILLSPAALGADVPGAIQRLKSSEDFRIRVSAALELGKSKSPAARVPLEGALDDKNAAVRAAAAAALKLLGDKRALPALERRQNDESASVRAQIKASVASLRGGSSSGGNAKVLVKLGKMKNGSDVMSKRYLPTLEKTSREKLGALPGVALVDGESGSQRGKKLPMVMVTGQLRKLKAAREGSEVVYSASVEYIVSRLPEESIVGMVSGNASTKATPDEAKNKRKSEELERTVVTAAIESAVRRVPQALEAATK
jgi:hypothetical protein